MPKITARGNLTHAVADTNLFLTHKNVVSLYQTMNQEFKQGSLWLTANKLSLNIKKT